MSRFSEKIKKTAIDFRFYFRSVLTRISLESERGREEDKHWCLQIILELGNIFFSFLKVGEN